MNYKLVFCFVYLSGQNLFLLSRALQFLGSFVEISKNLFEFLGFRDFLLLFIFNFDLEYPLHGVITNFDLLFLKMYEYFSSHFFKEFFFILLKIGVGFVKSHDGNEGSL